MTTDPELELRRNLASGNYERVQRMNAAILAKELGLDPNEFAKPFPGNSSITINHPMAMPPTTQPVPSPAPRRGLSPLASVALGLAAAAIPGAGLVGFLLGAAKPAAQVIEKVIEKPGRDTVRDMDFDVDMRVIPPDG